MVNPRITIETLLERVSPDDIKNLEAQLSSVSKEAEKNAGKLSRKQEALSLSTEQLAYMFKNNVNRELVNYAVRIRIATGQIKNFREGIQLGWIALRDMVSMVGLLNSALNIMISRFGTMLIIFWVINKAREAFQGMKDGFLALDTAIRKVASLVIPTSGDLGEAMKLLTKDMITFAIKTGTSFEQLSDTMFFLVSAGLESIEVHEAFAAVQNLVIGTSKDLTASMEENKKVVEVTAGLYKVFGESMTQFNTEQEKWQHISGVLFKAFQTNQILLEELATGLTFAAAQAHVAGISFEELVASLAVLNTNMVKGSKAGTSYANAVRDAIASAGKLKQIFDIDVGQIGRDFSFLESVIGPLNEQIKDTGFNLRFITQMMEVWNIRAQRSMVVLIDQYDEVKQLLKEMGHGEEDLAKAVELVNDSYKAQQGRLSRLKEVIGAMFAVGITGGKGMGGALKDINNYLEDNLRVLAAIAGILGIIVYILALIPRGVGRLEYELNIIGDWMDEQTTKIHDWLLNAVGAEKSMSELLAEIEDLEVAQGKAKEGTSKWGTEWERIMTLFAMATGDISSIEEMMDGIRRKSDELAAALSASATHGDSILRAAEALIPLLEGTEDVISKISGEFVDPTKWTATHDQLMNIFETMKTDGPEAVKKLNDVFTVQTRSLGKSIKDLDKYYQQRMDIMYDAYVEEKAELELYGYSTIYLEKAFFLESLQVLREYLAARRQQFSDHYSEEIAKIQRQSDIIASDFKTFTANINRHLMGIQWDLLRPADLMALTLEDIAPTDLSAFQKAIKDSYSLYGIKDELEYEHITVVNEILQKAKEVFLKNTEELGKGRARLTRTQELELADIYRESLSNINKMVDNSYRKQMQSVLTQYKIQLYGLKNLDDRRKALLDKALTDMSMLTEEEYAEFLELANNIKGVNLEVLDSFVKAINSLAKESEEVKKIIEELGLEKLLELLDQLGDVSEQAMDKLKKDISDIREETQNLNQVIDGAIGIYIDLIDIMNTKGKKGIEQWIEGMEILLDSILDVMNSLGKLREELAKAAAGEGGKFGELGAWLGFIRSITNGIRRLINYIRKIREESKETLQEEFLPEDATRRISPDFGQARVQNFRISLTPVFQFLSPGQLTEAQQRNLAETIYDEIVEISNSRGGAIV